jgi:hypothetical protein
MVEDIHVCIETRAENVLTVISDIKFTACTVKVWRYGVHWATSRKVAGSNPDCVIWNFLIEFRSHYVPWVDSATNRNENQGYFKGVKAASAWGWQPYHLHVLVVLNSGSLNLLELSGPDQACNGIDLALVWKRVTGQCKERLATVRVLCLAVYHCQVYSEHSLSEIHCNNLMCGWPCIVIQCG